MSDEARAEQMRKALDHRFSGWRSDFRPASEQLRNQRPDLLALAGRQLTGGWLAWYLPRGRWQPGYPLVLVFDGGAQLELAWRCGIEDHLSVTWNTIDPAVAPDDPDHEWRPAQYAPVAAVIGRTLTGWATVETAYFRSEHEDLDFSHGPPMHALAGWEITGLWIEFGDRGLRVYSGADATHLSAEPADAGCEAATRVTRWP